MVDENNTNHLDEKGDINSILKGNGDAVVQSVAQKLLEDSAVVTVTDRHGRIQYANNNFIASTKYSRSELLGKNHRILNSGYHPVEFFTDLWDTIKSGEVWQGTIRNRAKDGTFYWVKTTIVPFMDKQGRAIQFVSLRNDITDKKLLEEEYHLITENIMDLIVLIDNDYRIIYSTPSSKKMLDYNQAELLNQNILELTHEKQKKSVKTLLDSILKGKRGSGDMEFFLRNSSGKFLDVEVIVNPVQNKEQKEITQLVLVIRDISFRKQSEQVIHQLTHYDMLTGLSNRAFFLQQLARDTDEMEQSESMLATIYFDLDRFKDINDSLGPEAGDIVLIEIANRLRLYSKPTDVIARFGGDEFAILLKNVNDKREVMRYVHNLREVLEQPVKLSNEFRTITASLGVAMYPEHGTKPDELIKRANIASDTVKKIGRNDVLVFDDSMEEVSLDRILLENEMKNAVEADHFTIDYQPKFELQTRKINGIEALVRWKHPELGKIPPGKFIPVAEDSDLINEIGELVLRKACLQNKAWQVEGYKPLPISVNLSVKQFYDEFLLEKIKKVLEETRLDPKWLEIEVTESAFTDIDFAVAILNDIRELGIRVAIDDFGKGYSSFTYLKHLPVDVLKIDRMFVQDVDQFEESKAIVQGITEIAQKLRLDIVAEGIETESQLNTLIDAGLDKGQGFLFSKPIGSDKITLFFEKEN